MPAERRFRAMGSDGHLLVIAASDHEAEALADTALARVTALERCWSRFEPTSEVSRVNAASPHPWSVSNDTLLLATRAVDAARETGGRFDATLLPHLITAGYDRTFTEVAARSIATPEPSAAPAPAPAPADLSAAPFRAEFAPPNAQTQLRSGPGQARPPIRADFAPPTTRTQLRSGPTTAVKDDGWPGGDGPGGALLVDPGAATVAVRAGHGLDPGGLGKGLAADLVTAELLEAGATGALVSLGGDVRVRGIGPDGGAWPITIADPFDPDRELARLAITDGAVATSSRLLRRWTTPRGDAHHLLDPATGAPTTTDVAAVTVVAGEGWWAEALTKALFTLDADRGLGHVHHAAAIIVDRRHRILTSPQLEGVLR